MRRYRRNGETEKLSPPLETFSEKDWEKFQQIVDRSQDETLPVVVNATAVPYESAVYSTFTHGMLLAPILPRVPPDFEPEFGVGPGTPMLWSVFPEAYARGDKAAEEAYAALPPIARPSRLVYGSYLDAVSAAEKAAEDTAQYLARQQQRELKQGEWPPETDPLLGWEYDASGTAVQLWQPGDGIDPPLPLMPAAAWARAELASVYLPPGQPVPLQNFDYLRHLAPRYSRTAFQEDFDGVNAIPVWPRPLGGAREGNEVVWLVVTNFESGTTLTPSDLLDEAARLHDYLRLLEHEPGSRLFSWQGIPYAPAYLLRGDLRAAKRFARLLQQAYDEWLSLPDRQSATDTIYLARELCVDNSRIWREREAQGLRAKWVVDNLVGLSWITGVEGGSLGQRRFNYIGPWHDRQKAEAEVEDAWRAEERAAREAADLRARPAPRSGAAASSLPPLVGIVLKPPTTTVKTPPMLLAARSYGDHGDHVRLYFEGKQVGDGYFGGQMDECERSHTPGGVGDNKGTGYGAALYCALAVEAYQRYGRECLASAPKDVGYGPRSSWADAWWKRAVERGIAVETDLCQGCVKAELETFIDRGLVFWMASPGDFHGMVAEARDRYIAAFAAAIPDPDIVELIDQELAEHASDEAMAQWRAAYNPKALEVTPNRHRRRKRPEFVTPELEAEVEDLYADLDGL